MFWCLTYILKKSPWMAFGWSRMEVVHPSLLFFLSQWLLIPLAMVSFWPDLESCGWVAQFFAGSLPSCEANPNGCWLEVRGPAHTILWGASRLRTFSTSFLTCAWYHWITSSIIVQWGIITILMIHNYTSSSQVMFFRDAGDCGDLDGIMANSSQWFFTLFLHIYNNFFFPPHQCLCPYMYAACCN